MAADRPGNHTAVVATIAVTMAATEITITECTIIGIAAITTEDRHSLAAVLIVVVDHIEVIASRTIVGTVGITSIAPLVSESLHQFSCSFDQIERQK
jgi:hypothetical protein